tara:strand:- start:1326 stop:1850 length:525 start_codon:yes stop_codon:yes gene_type:complete
MEMRIKKKIDKHNLKFKEEVKVWLETNKCNIVNYDTEENKTNSFLTFIYEYEKMDLTMDDFKKRKRVKNIVPLCDRCNAKRANGEQCTRRKKENEDFCGTHIKGVPHGIKDEINDQEEFTDLEIWTEDIKGILYYIDKYQNVYNPNDIMSDCKTPEIIGKWEKNDIGYIINRIN